MALSPTFISKVKVLTLAVSTTTASVAVDVMLGNKSSEAKKVRLITNVINPNQEIIASRISTVIVKPSTKPVFMYPSTPFTTLSFGLLIFQTCIRCPIRSMNTPRHCRKTEQRWTNVSTPLGFDFSLSTRTQDLPSMVVR